MAYLLDDDPLDGNGIKCSICGAPAEWLIDGIAFCVDCFSACEYEAEGLGCEIEELGNGVEN